MNNISSVSDSIVNAFWYMASIRRTLSAFHKVQWGRGYILEVRWIHLCLMWRFFGILCTKNY